MAASGKVLKSMKPGEPGTKQWSQKFGKRLICVRYRGDSKRRMRLTTVEVVVETAKDTGRLCYVVKRQNGDDYVTTFEYRKDWLFRAYPGGRRELSIKGNELVQKAK